MRPVLDDRSGYTPREVAEILRGPKEEAKMRLLIPGGNGMVARMLAETARRRGHEPVLVPHADWDILDPQAGRDQLARHKPDVLVNCAAVTDVDGCETTRGEEALRVNGEGPGVLARACVEALVPILHLSTDFVFDGTADRPYPTDARLKPISVYGISKAAGEKAVMAAGGAWTILRTGWVYGPWGRNFVDTILRKARELERPDGKLRVVRDQVGAPTYTGDLADAILRLAGSHARGIVHFTNAWHCSWHAFAKEITVMAGLDVPVEAVTTAQFPRPAHRPAYSVLDLERYHLLTRQRPRPWPEALAEYFSQYLNAPKTEGV